MTMNTQGRPTRAAETSAGTATAATFTGNRGLDVNELLIFEVGHVDKTGVDLPAAKKVTPRLGNLARTAPIGLPGLTEPETMRHYVRLSRNNYAIDTGIYPLGSCTMKHNARLNEKMARLPGFGDIHPLQPTSTTQGALALIQTLAGYLLELTGMSSVAMSPKAGAHGELCGMLAIRTAHDAAGSKRDIVLVPESAHGTNPATAAFMGYSVRSIPARADGTVSLEAVEAALDDQVAAIMLTNPNTCGLFEPEIRAIADAVHKAGAYFYCDGANFNAIVGKVRPGDLGIDAMHINLHKTFSTPHGGGGPGAGPVVLSERLEKYAPLPFVKRTDAGFELVETMNDITDDAVPFGRLTAFHGQMGMFVRALAYMLSHGSDGMRQASEDAVLSANYIRVGLRDTFTQPFGDQPCMHEVLFDDSFLHDTEITTLDFAKAMIDEGFHPMTMYFPLVVHGAMLVEPTESESRASLDQFISAMQALAKAAQAGETERFVDAPRLAPFRRLDETRAARHPRLTWAPEGAAT